MAFALTGAKSHAEYPTAAGRADIIVELGTTTYIIEIKLDVSPDVALKQIEERRYTAWLKFPASGKKLDHHIAIVLI